MIKLAGKMPYVLGLIHNYRNWQLIIINRFQKKRIKEIRLRNGLTILGGKDSLIEGLINEIFVQKVYNPEFLPIHEGDTVIDIGANIGIFGVFAASKGAGRIIEIEPFPENIIRIKKNFSINKMSMPIILKAAVSDNNGTEKLFLGDLDSHNLLFKNNPKIIGLEKYIRVKTVTLNEIIQKYFIKRVNFLKIDCEGGEGSIIASTLPPVWEKIDKVAIEYHDNVSTISHQQIVKKLTRLGFQTKVVISDLLYGYVYAWKQ
ncbi:MAG: FkbM family methyltransferase [Candidatus Woesebacteria bacterium]|nr:FkbM family methyltransferase [Candidatus Woesebacteria bacterium]